MSEDNLENTHFGFSTVPLPDKQRRVDQVFHNVAARYDLMNDLMSAGLHRLWKDQFAAQVHPSKTSAFRHLDVAGGTGDIGFRIAKAGGPLTRVTLLDINPEMLAVGRARRRKVSPINSRLSKPMRNRCCFQITISTPIRSLSASATCRASMSR
jgi:demethylmenaquinone methyltransferase / 2-methoxy-6-polyprenyl-1,4-benzoquinol methylase